MAYTPWSVVFGEQPSAAKWNILGANDASFADGTGIDDGAVTPAKLQSGTGTSWVWQSWVPTQAGWSANPTGGLYYYHRIGKDVILNIAQPNNGTSNSGVCTFSLPVTAVTRAGARWTAPAEIVNNGTAQTSPGLAVIDSAGTIVTVALNYGFAAFTTSGNKRISSLTILYEGV